MSTELSPELIEKRKREFAEVDVFLAERRKQNREPDDIWSPAKRAEMLCRLGDVPPKEKIMEQVESNPAPASNIAKYGEQRDNYGKPKVDYIAKLEAMNDEELFVAAEQMIWLSAYANNNPRSDYHWQADATYDEAHRRGKPEIYTRAFKAAKASCGY